MKFKLLLPAMLLCGGIACAQNDPVLMKINGKPVSRSEFEYSYNKNNSESVADRKSVSDYVELFVNYKIKVLAAEEAGIDTTSAFKSEFLMYRNQQIRPSFISDDDMEREAWKVYKSTQERIDSNGGLVKPAHILVMLRQDASEEQQRAAGNKIDSIYNALKNGASFAELAKKHSDDKRSGADGGKLQWLQKGQTLKEFEETVFAMKKGELSKPFLSPAGYHVVLLEDKRNFFPYDTLRSNILQYLDQRGARESIITSNIDSIAKASVPAMTPDEVLERRAKEMEAKDPELKYLIKEYHDGLLLYEISNRNIWERVANDDAALTAYFKKNKKKYRWGKPRFKGIAYQVKEQADVKAVKDVVKKIPFEEWSEALRKTFNDSTVRILAVKGIFKEGDNAIVDKMVFGKDTTITSSKDHPIPAVYGERMKSPKSYKDVRELVVADCQEMHEKQWIAELRKKYPVEIDEQVLATVNKH